ncbi:AsnC family protein [Mesorhizobium sp. M1322]
MQRGNRLTTAELGELVGLSATACQRRLTARCWCD